MPWNDRTWKISGSYRSLRNIRIFLHAFSVLCQRLQVSISHGHFNRRIGFVFVIDF